MCDVEFDETHGAQGEVFHYDDVGDEPLRYAMKNMTIGDVKPQEKLQDQDQGGGTSSTQSSSSMEPQVDEEEEKEKENEQEEEDKPLPEQQEPSQQAQQEQVPSPPQAPRKPLVKHGRISKDYPLDAIIRSPSRGVRTHSRNLASFCESTGV